MIFDNLISKKGPIKMKINKIKLLQVGMHGRIVDNVGVSRGRVLDPIK